MITTNLCIEELSYWLVLRRNPSFGPRRFAALLQQEDSLSNCFNGYTPRSDFLQWCQAQNLKNLHFDWQGVESDLAFAAKPDQSILSWRDSRYPAQLLEIAQSPPILFVRGQWDLLAQPQIAMVGTRNPSNEATKNAYELGAALAAHGIVVTSGLALGIDAACHQGALTTGKTLAVLGNGLHDVYPAKHRKLADNLCEQGALVSEFPIGTPPKPENFPQRNRIISGLSLGVLVVEAAIKSGSLITANYALDQGRDIFAMPGSIHNVMAKGCHHLIRQGAKCVENVEHILEEFPQFSSLVLQQNKERLKQSASLKEQPQPKEELPSTLMQFLAHISDVCTPMDTMVDRTGLTVTEVSSMLLQLEMAGRVTCVPGGYIRVGTGG